MSAQVGIYFLWLKDKCVYVGQSTNVTERIYSHRGKRVFDRFTVMECEAHDMNCFEAAFINALRPSGNSIIPKQEPFPRLEGSSTARTATLQELITTTVPNFVSPTPSKETLRKWFDDAKIPRIKSNPLAKRGGGPVFYSVAAVEKLFTSKNHARLT